MTQFSIDQFAAELKSKIKGSPDALEAVRQHLKATMASVGHETMIESLEAAVPPDASLGELIVHQSDEITLLFARVPARFQSGIHNHTVCACIGQLRGQETSVTYQESDGAAGLTVLENIKAREGDVVTLGKDVIHHIENPLDEVSYSLHIYGGDFAALMEKRSLWSVADHKEIPFSFPALVRESALTMKKCGNEAGLRALSTAMPATSELVNQLAKEPST